MIIPMNISASTCAICGTKLPPRIWSHTARSKNFPCSSGTSGGTLIRPTIVSGATGKEKRIFFPCYIVHEKHFAFLFRPPSIRHHPNYLSRTRETPHATTQISSHVLSLGKCHLWFCRLLVRYVLLQILYLCSPGKKTQVSSMFFANCCELPSKYCILDSTIIWNCDVCHAFWHTGH